MDANEESLIAQHKDEDAIVEKRRKSHGEKDNDADDDYEDDDW